MLILLLLFIHAYYLLLFMHIFSNAIRVWFMEPRISFLTRNCWNSDLHIFPQVRYEASLLGMMERWKFGIHHSANVLVVIFAMEILANDHRPPHQEIAIRPLFIPWISFSTLDALNSFLSLFFNICSRRSNLICLTLMKSFQKINVH